MKTKEEKNFLFRERQNKKVFYCLGVESSITVDACVSLAGLEQK